jgi:hypothetical protein
MGAHTWGHTGTTGAVGCRGAAPGEQVGVSDALLKGTSSVDFLRIRTGHPPVTSPTPSPVCHVCPRLLVELSVHVSGRIGFCDLRMLETSPGGGDPEV